MPDQSFLESVLSSADETADQLPRGHRASGLAGVRYVLAVALLAALATLPMAVATGAGSQALERSLPGAGSVATTPFIDAAGARVIISWDGPEPPPVASGPEPGSPASGWPCAAKTGPLAEACRFR